jgi:hypothetical protein
MKRQCNQCGRMYTAKLETSRFCGGPCRAKWSKLRSAAKPDAPPSPPPARVRDGVLQEDDGRMPHLPVAGGGVSLYAAAIAEFAARGVAGTTPALQALAAAQRFDDPATSDGARRRSRKNSADCARRRCAPPST